MTRITTVQHSRSDLTCGRCQAGLPKGSAYRWAKPGFRSTTKLIRCMKPECAFRQSELTTSLLSGVYAAQEGFQDAIDGWDPGDDGDAQDLIDAVQIAADEAQGVADEYDAANDGWTQNGGMDNDDFCERRDAIQEWVDQLDIEGDLPERPDKPDPVDFDAVPDGIGDVDPDSLAEYEAAVEQYESEVGSWIDECREAAQTACDELGV